MGSKQRTLDNLTKLVEKNADCHRAGDIGELPVTQARVEAERFRGDLLVAQSDARSAELGLGGFAGLIEGAKAHPPDVFSARAAVEAARGTSPMTPPRLVEATSILRATMKS